MPRRKSMFDSYPFFRGDDIFDKLMRPIGFVEDVVSHYSRPGEAGITMAPINVEKNENGLRVTMAAPGLQESDFDIEARGNQLTISAETSQKIESDKESNYSWREYNYSNVTRTVALPKGVLTDQITAEYRNGELVVDIPTGDVAESVKIAVGDNPKQIPAPE